MSVREYLLAALVLCTTAAVALGSTNVPLASGVRMASDDRLAFVENRGQAPATVSFVAHRSGTTLWLSPGAILFDLHDDGVSAPAAGAAAARPTAPSTHDGARRMVFRERLLGTSPRTVVEPSGERAARYASFVGADPTRWVTGARSWDAVTYRNAWEGISLRVYGQGNDLEQEFVLAPGARPELVRIALDGVDGLTIDGEGALVVHTPFGPIRQRPPIAYQHADGGARVPVQARFRLLGRRTYGLAVERYDRARPLVVDPVLLYATYLGGIHDDAAQAVAVDAAGNAYVVGKTASEDFPLSTGAYQHTRGSLGVYVYNAFVSKFSPSGILLYSTFLGGTGAGGFTGDFANGVAVDTQGTVYVTGSTTSTDFPKTPSARQSSLNGASDAFVTVFDDTLTSLVYSTYLGGTGADVGVAIVVDDQRKVYVGGNAPADGLPVSPNAFQTTAKGIDNGFVAKLDPFASGDASLLWATYLGGHGNFGGLYAIAVDGTGHVYATGQTQASDFPTTTGALLTTMTLNGGCSPADPPRSAAFVAKLTPDGTDVVYSTYLGGVHIDHTGFPGCDQYGHAIAVTIDGEAVVEGSTGTSDFPTTPNAKQSVFGCCTFESFVTRLSASGSQVLASTYVSGGNGITFTGFGAVGLDAQKNAFVTGFTSGSQLPVTSDALQSTSGGQNDAFVTQVSADATQFRYSSYLGGTGDDIGFALATDPLGNTVVVGGTTSTSGFPVTPGAVQSTYAAGGDRSDAFVAVIGTAAIAAVEPTHGGNAGAVTLTIHGSGLADGTTAALAGPGGTIAARKVTVAADGTRAFAVFELKGVTPGTYDVSITSHGTTSARPGGFVVDAGGGAHVWVDVVGRPAIRTNSPATFFLTYGNSGNQDAYFVRLWVSVPTASLTIAPGGALHTPEQPAAGPPIDFSQVDTTVQAGDQTVVPFVIPVVPAGGTGAVPLRVTATVLQTGIPIRAWANPPAFQSLAALDALQAAVRALRTGTSSPDTGAVALGASLPDCYRRMIEYTVAALGFNLPQSCVGLFTEGFASSIESMVTAALAGDGSVDAFVAALRQVLYAVTPPVVACVEQATGSSPQTAAQLVDGLLDSLVDLVDNTILHQDCKVAVEIDADGEEEEGDDDDQDSDAGGTTDGAGAIDPNDKVGPSGGGPGRWIAPETPLQYLVEFENQPSATAPAQEVVVTDQLDPAKVDLSRFAFGQVFVGALHATPPAGANPFVLTIDQRPDRPLLVRVTGNLNTTTGLVTWRFSSIDPATGLPPADPTAGFLPPNTVPPAGEGGAVFTVAAANALAGGQTVSNSAQVVFDGNAPIVTPVWTNTIDRSQPTSSVTALAAAQAVAVFPLQWAGSDPGGPGVKDFTISVAVDDGPPEPWLINTTATSATYSGAPGHRYAFTSRVRDVSGQQESPHASADTSTAVGAHAKVGKLRASPRVLRFPATMVGKSAAKIRTVTLKAVGKTTLPPVSLGAVATSGDFSIVSNACPPSLTAGQHCTLTIGFAPATKGKRSGSATVATGSTTNPLTIHLHGKGR